MGTKKLGEDNQNIREDEFKKYTLKEKVNILASIVVDRIIEEQKNGSLNIYSNTKS